MSTKAPPAAPLPGQDVMPLADVLRLLNRYRWHVASMALLFGALGTVFAFSSTPIYRSTATVLIEDRPNQVLPVQEVYDPGFGSIEYYGTQLELVRSRDLVGKVVDQLGLAESLASRPAEESLLSTAIGLLASLPGVPAKEAGPKKSPDELRDAAIAEVQQQLRVDLVPRTQLMKVSIESPSPSAATQIANAIGAAYVQSGLETRLEATERAARWLNERMSDLRVKLEASEKALQAYREAHQLVNVGGSRGLYEEDLTDNARKLREAQNKKTQLGSTYWKIRQAGTDEAKLQEISSLLLEPPVQRAGDNLAQAESAMKQLQERYGEKHPQMTAAQARLDGARRAYAEALRLAANGVKAEYDIASETERALGSIVESGRSQIRKLDEQGYQLQALEREVDSNRQVYDLFLKRFKETDTTTQYEHLNARVVDLAIVPKVPFKPNRLRLILTWSFVGVLLGVSLVAVRHALSETVRTPEQLEQATGLAVLSVLPKTQGLRHRPDAPTLCLDQPRAPFSEGIRSIRASLYLSDVDRRMKRILFTSAVASEGKSSIASGFAVTLAQTERVLLIEADLRAPVLKKTFGIDSQAPGLMEVLTGAASLDQGTYKHAKSGLSVLPVAAIPANPSEVVSSAAFLRLMEQVCEKYDRVVFDSPPCRAGSDAALLSNRMDAVIFVIDAARTSLRVVQTAMKQLRAAQAPLLGHALNQVDARSSYGYGVHYAYGYDHGHGTGA